MMRHQKMRYIAIAVLGLFVITMFNGCKPKQKEETKSEAKNVKVMEAQTSTLMTTVEYPGKLQPVDERSISPKTAGKVSTMRVAVGQQVKAGEELFTLDTADAQAQLAQSQASVASARASQVKASDSGILDQKTQLESAVNQAQVSYDDAQRESNEHAANPANDSQILQAETSQKQAQIAYDNAQKTYAQKLTLYNSGGASQKDLDDAKTALDNAAISLNTANDNLKTLKEQQGNNDKLKLDNATIALNKAKDSLRVFMEKSAPQTINAASTQLSQAEAGLKLVQVQVDNGKIDAPISGTVSVRNVDIGEIASPSAAALTIIDTSSLVAEVGVPDKMIDKISNGQTLPVKIDALGDKTLNGVIDSISPSTDASTQTYTVKVKIDNADNSLKSGMFARVQFPAEQKDNILVAPNEAIKVESGVQYLYLVVDGAVKKQSVETGLSNDTSTEIKTNLKQGDLIITEGQIFLNDGEKVNVVKEDKPQG